MRTRLKRFTMILMLGLALNQWTHSDVSRPAPAPPVALKPMFHHICERRAFPPGTPISGCYFSPIPGGARCKGTCVMHDIATLHYGVCVEALGVCKPYQIQIRVGTGRKASCISVIHGVHRCQCPPPASAGWRPITGEVVTINTC